MIDDFKKKFKGQQEAIDQLEIKIKEKEKENNDLKKKI